MNSSGLPAKARLAYEAGAGVLDIPAHKLHRVQDLSFPARDGHTLKVKVYDKNAPSQRPAVVPKQEQQRTRERAAPVR